MDEVLRISILTEEQFLFWKKMFRGFVLIVGFVVLFMCAEVYSMEHRRTLYDMSGAESTGRIEDIPGRLKPVPEELAETFGSVVPENFTDTGNFCGYKEKIRKELKNEETVSSTDAEPVPVSVSVTDGDCKPAAVPVLTVSLYGNGGTPEVSSYTCEADEFSAETLTRPKRLGKLFDGWYVDAECKIPFDGTVGAETLELYAGWKEYPGYLCNDNGHIIGCMREIDVIIDGFLRIPEYETCTGIESGAFDTVKDDVLEVCIPCNIVSIAPGAFDSLSSLMYIEVLPGNPSYYSENGILYNRSGQVVCCPAGRNG